LFRKKFSVSKNTYSLVIGSQRDMTKISIDIFVEAKDNSLISVYTTNTHLQLQKSNYFILSSVLDEVIFVSENNKTVSGLIISQQGDCALYSNIDKKLLRSDFRKLSSEKLISAVALSLIES